MGKTFGELKTEVYKWLNVSSKRLDEDILERIINTNVAHLSNIVDFSFLQATATVSLSAGVGSYSFPSTISRLDDIDVFLTNGASSTTLSFVEAPAFFALYGNTTTNGTPVRYTYWDEKIYVDPPPDGSMTLTIYGLYKSSDMTTDSEVNPVLTNMWDVVLYSVLADALMFLMEEQRSQGFKAEAQKRLIRYAINDSRIRNAANRPASMEAGREV